jgi:hypothetical protein
MGHDFLLQPTFIAEFVKIFIKASNLGPIESVQTEVETTAQAPYSPAHQTGERMTERTGRPELTKRPNFTYRVKIDISASAEKPQVANFRTIGQTDRVYRTVFKVSLRPRRHRS